MNTINNISVLVCVLLCFCTITSYQLTIEPQSFSSESLRTNLGFSNVTGENTSRAQVNSFVNFINSASSFYPQSLQTRLEYISNKMNATYGASSQGYSVVQMVNQTSSSWAIYSGLNSSKVYASVEAGTDKTFQTASYMFMREPSQSGRIFFYTVDQSGDGIDYSLKDTIDNIIRSVERADLCSCTALSPIIRDKLIQYDGGHWNVFCSSRIFAGLIYSKNSRALSTAPWSCYYLIYDNK